MNKESTYFFLKKIQLSYCFPNCFQWIFLRKRWVDSSFVNLSISKLLGLGKNPFSTCVDSRRGQDQAWCGLQVCSERWRWEAEIERCQSSGSGRIGRLELGKTLYSVFVFHSRHFWSVVGPWFFISLEVFHIKIWCHCLFLSFYSLIYFQFLISLIT